MVSSSRSSSMVFFFVADIVATLFHGRRIYGVRPRCFFGDGVVDYRVFDVVSGLRALSITFRVGR